MKNKEICRETTTRGSGKMGLAYMALLAICCSWAYEGFRFNSTGVISPVGMGLNFLWPFLFFGLQAFSFAFFWLVLLWALLVWMTLSFRELDRPAAYLQIPYLVWVFFAGYLNFGVWMLNGS